MAFDAMIRARILSSSWLIVHQSYAAQEILPFRPTMPKPSYRREKIDAAGVAFVVAGMIVMIKRRRHSS